MLNESKYAMSWVCCAFGNVHMYVYIVLLVFDKMPSAALNNNLVS